MKLTKKTEENLMKLFSNKLVFCKQLLLQLDLDKTRLTRIYECDFEIVGDKLHKPILMEKQTSGIENAIYNNNRIEFKIQNKFTGEDQFASISMYKKRTFPRLTIENTLAVDTGTELLIELNSASKELTNELVEGKEVENSYTTQYNIKDIVSLNAPMNKDLANIVIQIYYGRDCNLPILIIKNATETIRIYKETFNFEKRLIANPFLEEVVENRFLYNSALSPVNVTKLHLQNSKYDSFVNMYGKRGDNNE